MAEAVLPDGSVVKLPDFALEATQAQMLATLKVLLKEDTETQDLYKKLLKEVEDGNKNSDKANEKAQKALDDIVDANKKNQGQFLKKVSDRIEGDVQDVFVGAGRAISGLATAAVLATGAIIGFGAKVFTNLTDNLKDLTQAGLGFTDGLGNTASSAILEFNKLGYTTAEASQAMIRFASVTATIGRSGTPGSLTDTIKRFRSMTDSGLALGMSFKDAEAALLEELETRNDLGMIEGSVTQRQLAGASQQIKMQTAYSAALGISADKLREMSKRQVENNTGLMVLNKQFGEGVYESAMAFSTAMNARGDALSKLAEVFLEAGGQNSVFISEASRDLASASPIVSGYMKEFAQELRDAGRLGAEDARIAGEASALKLQKRIGNLQLADLRNLQRIVEAGGAGAESAKIVLLAYRDVKKTEAAMRKVAEFMGKGFNIDKALAAKLRFDNAWSQVKTTFDTITNSIAVQFSDDMLKFAKEFEKIGRAFVDVTDEKGNVVQRGIASSLVDGFKKISNSILKLFGFDVEGMVDENGIRTTVVERIDKFTTSISQTIDDLRLYLDSIRDESGNIQWSEMFKDIALNIVAGILKGIAALPGLIFDGIVSYINGTMDAEDATAREKVMSSITNSLLKIIGTLFAVGAAKSVIAAFWGKAKGFIAGESAETLSKQRSGGLWDRIRGRGTQGPTTPGGGGAPGSGPGGSSPRGGGKPNTGAGFASLLTNIGKGLGGLGKGLGDFIKGFAGGAAKGIESLFKGLARGIGALGKPNVLLGSVALGLISGAVFIAGKAFQQFQQLDWATVGKGLTAILGIGAIAAVAGSFAPLLLAGAAAIGAIGLALMLFPADTLQTLGDILNNVVNTVMVNMPPIINAVADGLAKLVEVGAKGFDTIMQSVGTLLERLSVLDAGNLLAAAGAIGAVGLALAGLGAGSIIGGIGNFFGSLFGGGDPFTRLLEVAKSAPELDKLSGSLKTLATVLGTTGDMIERLAVQPLESIVEQFTKLWQDLSQVELNVKPYQDFAAISTAALLGNAAAINQIAAANRAQNRAYAEFISLDEAKFAKNVTNAFNYNKANKGETEGTSILDTVKNMFNALRSSPATPVNPVNTSPTGAPPGSTTGTPTTGSPAATGTAEKNASGKTQIDILTDIERYMRSAAGFLEEIKKNTA